MALPLVRSRAALRLRGGRRAGGTHQALGDDCAAKLGLKLDNCVTHRGCHFPVQHFRENHLLAL
jgi:hypothetical protein